MMSQNSGADQKVIMIPDEVYSSLVDFCFEVLGLESVPEEKDMGLVVAYLLGRGMQALEDEESAASQPARPAS